MCLKGLDQARLRACARIRDVDDGLNSWRDGGRNGGAEKVASRRWSLCECLFGGYPSFRWDLLGFSFARVWLSYCLFFAQIEGAVLASDAGADAFVLIAGTASLSLFCLLGRKPLRAASSQRLILAASLVAGAIGVSLVLVFTSFGSSNSALLLAALPFLGASAGLLQALWGIRFAFLPLPATITYSLCAMLLAALLTIITNPLTNGVQVSTFVFLPAMAVVLLFCNGGDVEAAQLREDLARRRSEVESTGLRLEPAGRNVVKFLAALFAARFLYGFVYNYVITVLARIHETPDIGTFVSSSVAILIVLAFYLVRRERFDPVPLYRIVLPVIVVGVAFAYLFVGSGYIGSIALLSIGYKLFDLVFWILLFKAAKYRVEWAASVLLLGVGANYLGMGLGRLFVSFIDVVDYSDATLAAIVIGSSCVLVLVSVLVLPERFVTSMWNADAAAESGKGKGSIPEGERVATDAADKAAQPGASIDFEAVLAELAERYLLTGREAQVLGYLARGRSQPFIASELSIARGTVHAHVSRIYSKLGIGSQDELIDLVESSRVAGRDALTSEKLAPTSA